MFLLLGLGGRYKKAELPEERIFQRTILSNAEDVMDVCRELEAFCEVWGADMKQQMISNMTVEELGMAILKHGFQGRTDGYLQLTAIMDESGVLELHLRDDATTFNPFTLDTSRASRDEAFDMDGMGARDGRGAPRAPRRPLGRRPAAGGKAALLEASRVRAADAAS